MRRLSGLLLLLALAGAPTARAAVDPGPGVDGSLSVAADGTGYLSYDGTASGDGRASYVCVLPRGATACTPATTRFSAAQYASPRPRVLRRADGSLIALSERCCYPGSRLLAWTSADGATWSPSPASDGTELSAPNAADTSGDAILSPDGTGVEIVNGAATTGGVRFQYAPLAGGTSTQDFQFTEPGQLGGNSGSLANATPTLTIAAYVLQGGDSSTYAGSAFSTFSGTPGPAMNSGGWSAPQHLDAGAEGTVLTQGPRGVGLVEQLNGTLLYRRFDGAGAFGAPITIASGVAATGVAAAQDAGGHVHVVFAHGFDGTVYYTRSDDGGATWPPVIKAVDGLSRAPVDLGVGAGSDGDGWLTYRAGDDPTAVPLHYVAPAPPPVVTPTPTPTPMPPAPSARCRLLVPAAQPGLRRGVFRARASCDQAVRAQLAVTFMPTLPARLHAIPRRYRARSARASLAPGRVVAFRAKLAGRARRAVIGAIRARRRVPADVVLTAVDARQQRTTVTAAVRRVRL